MFRGITYITKITMVNVGVFDYMVSLK